MSSFLIGATIHDQATLEQLPIGAGVVDDDGGIWQKAGDSYWEAARDRACTSGILMAANESLTLIWLPFGAEAAQ